MKIKEIEIYLKKKTLKTKLFYIQTVITILIYLKK